MVEVAFLPAADEDYQETLDWYLARSTQAAAGFEAAVGMALESIGKAPGLWPLTDDRHRFYTLRRYPFSVIYRVEAAGVLVVAVAHASRSANYWQGRA